MKLPRDITGKQFAQSLARLGYTIDHQTGSHIRLTTREPREHHITVPAHNPLKVGTLNAILRDLERHTNLSRPDLLRKLFH